MSSKKYLCPPLHLLAADPIAPDTHNNAERLNDDETLSSHHPFYLIKTSMCPKEFVLFAMGWKLPPRNRHLADVPGFNCTVDPTMATHLSPTSQPVIGHGIVGKDIPIMAHQAEARRWSKR